MYQVLGAAGDTACSAASATARRKSPSLLFYSSSTSAFYRRSSGPRSAWRGCRNTILAALPGDHLSLTCAPRSKYWGIPPDARSPPKFHHERGR